MAKITQPKDITIKSVHGKLGLKVRFGRRYREDWEQRLDIMQKTCDNACIKYMTPYVPMQSGVLTKSALLNTVIGSGKIVYATPYARYLYYGEKYAPSYPITKNGVLVGFFSPPHKYPTGIPLNYSKDFHPLAGSHWFERMKTDHKNDILKEIKQAGGIK